MSVFVVFDSFVEAWFGVRPDLVSFSLDFVSPAVFAFLFFDTVQYELSEFYAFI